MKNFTEETEDNVSSEHENHFIRLPMTTSLGGKTTCVDLTVFFSLNPENNMIFYQKVDGLVGRSSYDMSHLTQTHGVTITNLILGNKEQWDVGEIWYRPTDKLLSAV